MRGASRFGRSVRVHVCIWALGLALGIGAGAANAWAFDVAGYKSKLAATQAELATKSLSDSKATLGRLDEMIAIGMTGAKEYGDKQPKYAKLMGAVVADANAMKGLTDPEIESQWGEQGTAGDAAGVALKSLGQFDETRAVLELVVGPAHAYILIKKWETAQKARWLDQANDQLTELSEHMKKIP